MYRSVGFGWEHSKAYSIIITYVYASVLMIVVVFKILRIFISICKLEVCFVCVVLKRTKICLMKKKCISSNMHVNSKLFHVAIVTLYACDRKHYDITYIFSYHSDTNTCFIYIYMKVLLDSDIFLRF